MGRAGAFYAPALFVERNRMITSWGGPATGGYPTSVTIHKDPAANGGAYYLVTFSDGTSYTQDIAQVGRKPKIENAGVFRFGLKGLISMGAIGFAGHSAGQFLSSLLQPGIFWSPSWLTGVSEVQAAAVQATIGTIAAATSGALLIFDDEQQTGLLPTFLNFMSGPLWRSAARLWGTPIGVPALPIEDPNFFRYRPVWMR